jgi:hypothetical protein
MSNSENSPRHGYRFRSGVPAKIYDGGRTIACEAQNISRSGVLLVGNFPVPSASAVEFELGAPTGHVTLRLSGRVIRVEPDADGEGLRIALEFLDMDASRRDALELLLARLLEAPAAGPFDGLKPGAPFPEVKKALEAIPLPHRIALSSRAGLKEREILRLDTNPAVLEALVRNPSLGVAEARAIATSQYLMSGTLDSLANDPRFKGDEELRMAVALHPRVSMSTAERVTADFKVPQIHKLLGKPGLNQILREKLFRRTSQR